LYPAIHRAHAGEGGSDGRKIPICRVNKTYLKAAILDLWRMRVRHQKKNMQVEHVHSLATPNIIFDRTTTHESARNVTRKFVV